MDFLKNLYKSARPEPSPQQLQSMTNEQKMEHILQSIKSTHSKLMSEISQQFQSKVEYEQNICYDLYKTDMDQFANCAFKVSKEGDRSVELYKKKIAFISILASRCLFEDKRTVPECKQNAIEVAKDIMGAELEYIKNWNPHVAHVAHDL